MYETYLQNERKFIQKVDKEFMEHHGTACIPVEVNKCFCEVQNNISRINDAHHLSIIKVMKALEKELEGEVKGVCCPELKRHDDYCCVEVKGYNQALNLSLDKIREFISKLEENETKK